MTLQAHAAVAVAVDFAGEPRTSVFLSDGAFGIAALIDRALVVTLARVEDATVGVATAGFAVLPRWTRVVAIVAVGCNAAVLRNPRV